MKRTRVKLPDDVHARLRCEAGRRGITVSELVGDAITTHLGRNEHRKLLAAKAGRSGTSDTAVRIEEMLASELFRERRP